MDLNNLQKRARKNLKDEANESILRGNRRKRVSPLRIFIWLVEALILLVALEHFVIRPQLKQVPSGTDARQSRTDWRQAEPRGAAALDMRALDEAATIYLPPTERLATGSKSAQEAQLVVSEDRNLPVEVVNSLGMRFRLIPNGSFIMGSPETEEGHFKGEKQHVAHITEPFYISETEVTQAQWTAVMGPDSNPSGFKGRERPVEEVDWHDCQKFLVALAEQDGVPRWTYRLPTEKQWEYAARAGTDTPYYFGTDVRKLRLYEWYKVNSFGRSHKVARLRPNAYGLYDMLGNVWEWCWDTYKTYPDSPEKLDPGKDWTKIRVIRGGNWYLEPDACRAAARTRLGVTSKGNMLGFRVVRHIYELNEAPQAPPGPEEMPDAAGPPPINNDGAVIPNDATEGSE